MVILLIKDIYLLLLINILPQIDEWKNRHLDMIYLVVYINAIHYSVWYNSDRIKQLLGFMSPMRYRKSLHIAV